MRILQIISSGGNYGAEAVLLTLVKSLEKLNCSSVLAVFLNEHKLNTDLATLAQKRGLQVQTLTCKGRFDPAAIRAIKGLIRDHNIDVVHTHGYKSNFYAFLAAKSGEIPVVATCHGYTRASAAVRLYSRMDRMLLRRFHQVVAVSTQVEALLLASGIPRQKLKWITNAVEVEKFKEASPTVMEGRRAGSLIVGTVARLVREKGIGTFLLAIQNLVADFPEAKFVLVGEGPHRRKFEQQAKELGIAEHVFFTGERRDMPGVYASMDIFVLPSLIEGMPMTILEAMAAGLPIVATSVGDIDSVILEGQTGLLVPPGDRVALENAIRRMLTDEKLRRRLSANAQALVGLRFTVDAMASEYLNVYANVTRRAGAALLSGHQANSNSGR